MTEATTIIINAILSACGAAIFTGICVWVKGLYRKSKNYDKAVKAHAEQRNIIKIQIVYRDWKCWCCVPIHDITPYKYYVLTAF